MSYDVTYVALDKQTVTTPVTSIDFSGISSAYTDLRIVVSGTTVFSSSYLAFRFNGDTSSNYTNTEMVNNGAAVDSFRNTAATYCYVGSMYTSQTTNTIDIADYANATTFKTLILDMANAANSFKYSVGTWKATPQAITSINISTAGAVTFATGTTFSLYGIAATGSNPTAQATGGTITYDANYTYHTFTSSGTFTPAVPLTCDILAVAGGGGGGADMAGGGGAGGLLGFAAQSLTATGYSVTVGAGGAGSPGSSQLGSNGANSQFGGLTASIGGGRSGNYASTTGASGGSGGGAGRGTGTIGGAGTSSQGFAGGNGSGVNYDGETGGGGGAGKVGQNGNATGSGDGGVGSSTYSSWGLATRTGQNLSGTYYYAGGGGGGWQTSGTVTGTGGYGGGGNGAAAGVASTAGTANTGGGGGGGAGGGSLGRAGGSGIVIIRYENA